MQSLLVCPSVTAFLYTGVTCRLFITAQLVISISTAYPLFVFQFTSTPLIGILLTPPPVGLLYPVVDRLWERDEH